MGDRTSLSEATDQATDHVESMSAFCPRFHHAVELVGRRWTGAILRAMLAGNCRFSDIAGTVPGLSDRLLSERLKELMAEGLISRDVDEETHGRVQYHLTAKGRELAPVIESLSAWADTWIPSMEPEPAERV